MDEASADKLAHGSLSGVLGIATLGIGVEDEDQLVHREPRRVFVEEERARTALSVFLSSPAGEEGSSDARPVGF